MFRKTPRPLDFVTYFRDFLFICSVFQIHTFKNTFSITQSVCMNLTCILKKILDKKLHIRIYNIYKEKCNPIQSFSICRVFQKYVNCVLYVFGRPSDESRLFNRLAQFRFWTVLFNKVFLYFFSICDAFLK